MPILQAMRGWWIFVVGLLASTASAPITAGSAAAQDLGDALDYAKQNFDRSAGAEYDAQWRNRSQHEAIGMLSSRDVEKGRPLFAYDCLDSAIDTMPILRSSSKEAAALRGCLEHRFAREELPGYRTLGRVKLDAAAVRPVIESEAARHEVPAIMLDAIIAFGSGYRPHAVSDSGYVGLMQLRPDHLAEYGVAHGDLMDPRENIRAGAAYLRALVFELGGLRKALLAWRNPEDMTYSDRTKRWFVNFTMKLYLGSNRKFPYRLGAENISFVWTWLE